MGFVNQNGIDNDSAFQAYTQTHTHTHTLLNQWFTGEMLGVLYPPAFADPCTSESKIFGGLLNYASAVVASLMSWANTK